MGKNILSLFKKKRNIRLADFLYDHCNTSRRSTAYIRVYRSLARRIEAFEQYLKKDIFTDSFDERTVGEYIHFLRSFQPEKRTFLAYKQATVRSYYQKTISAVNKAGRQGYKVNTAAFSEYSVKDEDTGAVYLTMKELSSICSLRLRGEAAQVRDIFLVGCLTGLRYSDYSRLSEENFLSGNITILTKKTETKVSIPIHYIIKEIITRNQGYGFLKYKCSQQNFNKMIKGICKKAGIVDKVMIEYTRGFKKVRKVYKKYELISSHTARRTAATNMYLAGIPTFRIMLITGHKSETSFYRYIRIQKEENANELQVHSYFNRVA